jgi:hypothetical protein
LEEQVVDLSPPFLVLNRTLAELKRSGVKVVSHRLPFGVKCEEESCLTEDVQEPIPIKIQRTPLDYLVKVL